MEQKAFLFVYVICLVITCSQCVRTKDMIYETITGAAACFRKLNGTHQFGCSSDMSGNVGILYFINSGTDIQLLQDHGTRSPYIAVLNSTSFNLTTIAQLKDTGKVNGVLVFGNITSKNIDKPWSHEDNCPNRYSGLSSFSSQTCSDENAWNPYGTGLMLYDVSLPIFYINDAEVISKIESYYLKHNFNIMDPDNENALCAMQLKTFMLAAVDSETCYRRSNLITNSKVVKFCDPLGDENILYTVHPRCKHCPEDEGSVILVTSRMDTSSMFDGVAPGAGSPVTGMVTLMATASLLSKMMADMPMKKKNVMFIIFQGESYDYIGSSRMLWDMKQRGFPMKEDDKFTDQPPPLAMEHIGLYVELDQIFTDKKESSKKQTLYFYRNQTTSKLPLIQNFLTKMNTYGELYNFELIDITTGNIPPSSLQTFLAENDTFPGLVIAGYKDKYVNNYYHSIYDDQENIKYEYYNGSLPPLESIQSLIANVSVTLASTLFSMLTDENATDVEPDPAMIDELLYCYLVSLDCSIYNASTYNTIWRYKKNPFYVGVDVVYNPLTRGTGKILSYLTGTEVPNVTKEECVANETQRVYFYMWVNGNYSLSDNSSNKGVCINTTVNYSKAVSPAFEINGYDWSSGKYSTWTESVWPDLSIRMFLKPSKKHDALILSLGLVVLFLSFSLSYFANKYGSVLFKPPLSSTRTL